MISESFQAGELSSDLDSQNSTNEKLKQKEKQELLSSSGSSSNQETSAVTSPIAMRYWNYCTGRGEDSQVL